MRPVQKIGLSLFLASLAVFVLSLTLGTYQLTEDSIQTAGSKVGLNDAQLQVWTASASEMLEKEYSSQFPFISDLEGTLNAANEKVAAENGVTDEEMKQLIELSTEDGNIAYSAEVVNTVFPPETVAKKNKALTDNTNWMFGKEFTSKEEFVNNLEGKKNDINNGITNELGFAADKIKNLKYHTTKASSIGIVRDNLALFAIISFVLTILGGFMYILPQVNDGPPGIKNHGVFFTNAMNRGWIGITLGTFLIAFYIFLYKFPEYITNWVMMLDPLSLSLSGKEADQWFMYGFMYCLAMGVMGVRMIIKYRHNRYQIVRTSSILFFQFAFAFTIPQILKALDKPSYDLKSAWPLEYTFFFDYRLDEHIKAGNLGEWMIGWGIVLFLVGVPLFTYFYGKRWYCSWVCGCGGLAETLGDPFRQQSDKSRQAWKIERWLIHAVLVFAIVMTLALIYTFVPEEGGMVTKNMFVPIAIGLLSAAAGITLFLNNKRQIFPKSSMAVIMGVAGAIIGVMVYNHYIAQNGTLVFLNPDETRSNYGFLIGFVFAGVVGTGFYPLMGNRMWCRFGCPLAAYLGLVQRIKSKFRITTNGGQCISCGNCSTYCEMGIDVRWYAQRGQNIVRSSCVGCGICAAVCPRGVLKLENGSNDDQSRMDEVPIMIGNDGVLINQNLVSEEAMQSDMTR